MTNEQNCIYIKHLLKESNTYCSLCLVIFSVEVLIRLAASSGLKVYFQNKLNVFDFSVVVFSVAGILISRFVDASFSGAGAVVSILRLTRCFRLLRVFTR